MRKPLNNSDVNFGSALAPLLSVGLIIRPEIEPPTQLQHWLFGIKPSSEISFDIWPVCHCAATAPEKTFKQYNESRDGLHIAGIRIRG
jgi:hypothetical protein